MPEAAAEVAPVDPAGEAPGATAWAGSAAQWHQVLLRVAGAVPDDLLAQAREWLADGERVDVAMAVAFAASAAQVPVLASDVELILAELAAAGEDTAVVAELHQVGDDTLMPETPWIFAPERPADPEALDQDPGSPAGVPLLTDLSTGLGADPAAVAALEEPDRAALEVVRSEPRLTALWRAWRYLADGPALLPPCRVLVVSAETDGDDDELPGLTARLQRALAAAGEVDPQVELCLADLPVPVYQDSARAGAALLWAREPAGPLDVARVFDAVDAGTGPRFDPDHPVIDDEDELARLLDYLDSAVPVLPTTALMADVLDPEHPEVVPLTFRTDGRWIWTDTISYYLEIHGIAPEPGLLRHLRAAPELPPPVSDVAYHRVLAHLQEPHAQQPVWTVP